MERNILTKASGAFMAAVCIITALITGCSKTSEDKLQAQHPLVCDTSNATYTGNVLPILKANCYSCHGNGQLDGGINLGDYQSVKIQIDNGALLGAITHSPGYTPMPNNLPQLSDCDINTIKAWIIRGALNN